MHEEMIRDRIVVGICDNQLSQKMQDLTLKKAIELARQSETAAYCKRSRKRTGGSRSHKKEAWQTTV